MSYRASRNRRRPGMVYPGRAPGHQPNYAGRQTGVRRHEFTAEVENTNTLGAGNYVTITNLKFARTFSTASPADPDEEPVATLGNNYQTPRVMNGSRVQNFRKKITIRNNQLTDAGAGTQKTVKYDVYELTLSFWDAFILETYEQDAGLINEIINFEGNDADPHFGEVDWDPAHPLTTNNQFNNSTFLQRYYRHKGQISIEAGGQAELNINYLPPKVRRSNSGMFWGILLLNDSIANAGESIVCNVMEETSFEEIPSSERNPPLY